MRRLLRCLNERVRLHSPVWDGTENSVGIVDVIRYYWRIW